MTSSFTTNKSIEKPANGDYNNTWSTPVNNDWDIIDQSLGGQTSLNVVGASGVVTLTTSQYRSPIIIISGTLTANVNYQLPSGIGGFWYIYNNTTGSFTVTFSSAAGGTSLVLAQGFTTTCISDGTNIGRGDTAPGAAGTGVTSFSFGTTGLLPATNTTGAVTATGTLNVSNGGTGATTLASGSVLVGAGTSAVSLVAPGSSGNVLTSNGTGWTSQALTGTVTSVTASGSGISASPTSGAVIIQNTGVTSIVAGSGISISGATGAVTITATGGGSGTVALNNGSAASPSLYFTNSTTMGLYRVAADEFGIAAAGARIGWLTAGSTAIAIGQGALAGVTSGTQNVAIGNYTGGVGPGGSITSGGSNVCLGSVAGYAVSTGNANVAVGTQAMYNISNKITGNFNTGIGYQTYVSILGSGAFSGANTTCLGNGANPSTTSVSNEITLGNASIATLRCQVTTITSLSDARDKANIVGLNAGLDFVNALNPVRFTWNMRPTKGPDGEDIQGRVGDEDTGFIAQELKAAQETTGVVIPGLVYEVNPESIEAGYGKLLPVLVKAIQELSAKVDALEAQIAST